MLASKMSPFVVLRQYLQARLARTGMQWFKEASTELTDGISDTRFCGLLSLASRHAKRVPLSPDPGELEAARRTLAGWNPERWTCLDALRVAIVLSRPDLAEERGALALEEAFRFADEGELVALYRSLALWPDAGRFVWRAGEGCRTNMKSVFEATALDNPFPVTHFDDPAWNQVVIKCLFVEAPLWRLYGLDTRLSPELARMALDLADERRSAGRPVYPELWLCLGEHAGTRGVEALEAELAPSNSHRLGRAAALYGLARAGAGERLEERIESESDALVQQAAKDALAGNTQSSRFGELLAQAAALS